MAHLKLPICCGDRFLPALFLGFKNLATRTSMSVVAAIVRRYLFSTAPKCRRDANCRSSDRIRDFLLAAFQLTTRNETQ